MSPMIRKLSFAVLAISLLAPSAWLRAENPGNPTGGQFAKKHPRRNEVNTRVHNQRKQLKQQLKAGKITQQQYNDQMAALKNVKNQEHADVSANGGYITKGQDKALNQELNLNRKEINQDVKNGAAPPVTPPPPPPGQ